MDFGIHDFRVFAVASAMLAITPGQDTLYVLGRSVAQGWKTGIASVIGIVSGAVVHVLAGAFGLSALLIASPSAFFSVKLAGGAYLIYLGSRLLFAKGGSSDVSLMAGVPGFWPTWRQGLLTNLLNPKVALFILAFLPQFIDADSPSKFVSFLLLGSCFFAIGTAWLLCVVAFSSAIFRRLRESPRLLVTLNRLAGALFLVLGLRLLAG